jgi:tetratricopeptide (TPR) repeat protein
MGDREDQGGEGEQASSTNVEARAEALREQGNGAYLAGQAQKAVDLYTAAIDCLDDIGAPAQLYGNRSAAHMSLGQYCEALSDANNAIGKNPLWVKGYHRAACAHKALNQHMEVYGAYACALRLEPENGWLRKQVQASKLALHQESLSRNIPSRDYFMAAYTCMPTSHHRLFILASFWNACTKVERHSVLGRFLDVLHVGEQSHVGLSAFSAEMMQNLPMDNYVDFAGQYGQWVEYFCSLATEAEKVRLMESMWEAASEEEKDTIVQDLKHFFLDPLLRPSDRELAGGEDDDDGSTDEAMGQ